MVTTSTPNTESERDYDLLQSFDDHSARQANVTDLGYRAVQATAEFWRPWADLWLRLPSQVVADRARAKAERQRD